MAFLFAEAEQYKNAWFYDVTIAKFEVVTTVLFTDDGVLQLSRHVSRSLIFHQKEEPDLMSE